MTHIVQPLVGEQRRIAIANIERAADLLSLTRWCVAGAVLLLLLLFRHFFFPVLIPGLTILCWIVAHGMSGPVEEMAADVRNRDAKPLVGAMAAFGLVAAAELVALALLSRSFMAGDDAAPVLAFLVLVLLAATGCLMWRFAAAWRAIQHLRRETVSGFTVITAGEQPSLPIMPPVILPPRPKR